MVGWFVSSGLFWWGGRVGGGACLVISRTGIVGRFSFAACLRLREDAEWFGWWFLMYGVEEEELKEGVGAPD